MGLIMFRKGMKVFSVRIGENRKQKMLVSK